ncbi:hypothetical protein SYNPS1DRAFT_24395 [Syncephalis pseudoplumigaleata]|uniref:Uncharacterized protein n=1 Tax=Syncephalis pseudoplumigaleata TaxID=1712513 RepID=A0A4P9YUU5_9FUNG|nr:hypothetical protein SYNPS1DRAFT_24395 [Syncephalis pseudoplumigaleata]|eukprot:RKP23548.1 hypothetical protein SYNPS1DRAFT_24395 [Syncephalis pseudoplumigaleata]
MQPSGNGIMLEVTWQDTLDRLLATQQKEPPTSEWSWLRFHQTLDEASPLILTVQLAPHTSSQLDVDDDELRRVLSRQLDRLAEWQMHAGNEAWHRAEEAPSDMSFDERLEQFLAYHHRRSHTSGDANSPADGMGRWWDDAYGADTSEAPRELDLTEELWQLCQMAADHEEIADAIYAVLEEVRDGRIQPRIHHYNDTALARVLRDANQLSTISNAAKRYQQLGTVTTAAEHCLAAPISSLASIGRMKLQQDYLYYCGRIDPELVQRSGLVVDLGDD